MLKAVMAGHAGFQPVIQAIIRLAEKAAKEPRELSLRDHAAVEKAVRGRRRGRPARRFYSITQKQERYAAVNAVKAKVMAALAPEGAEPISPREQVAEAFHSAQAKVVRWNILDHQRRIDGRDLTTVRPILAEVGVLPRTHGSALTRPRRNPSGGGRDAGHRRGRAICQFAGRDLQGAVPAPL